MVTSLGGPKVTIKAETPLQDEVRAMIEELNAVMNPLSPPQFQFQMTAEQIDESDTTLFLARDGEGRALGMGALKVHDENMGEVKRMYTRPQARGKGVGWKLLQQVEALAAQKGLKELKLETGEAPGFEEAWKVYERSGYTVCGAFLDYPDSGWSRFYMKKLG